MPSKSTDVALLRRASRGDQAALEAIYLRHREPVFRFIYRMLGSSHAAEDVLHDCFLSLLRSTGRFDPDRASLRTYLFGIARNLCLKHFRASAFEVEIDPDFEEAPASADARPLDDLLELELAAAVREAVAALTPLQREAVILFEYERLSLAEIAEVVGTDAGTVKSRLHRARRHLRRALAPYYKSESRIAAVQKVAL